MDTPLFAQVEPPSNEKLFREDLKDYKKREIETKKLILHRDNIIQDPGTYFKAPEIEYLQDKEEFVGTGGVIVSYSGNQIQGDSGRFNAKTKEGELTGGLVFSSADGEISAQSGSFNLDKEVGRFNDAKVVLEPDGYVMEGGVVEKLTEIDYRLSDASMTTCHCADGQKPWSVTSPLIDITQEGYAKARPFMFRCNDIPIFYAPYMIFPAKLERSSGLLIPKLGYSSKNGLEYAQPIFVNVNENTDLTLTPFTKTETRYGITGQYSQRFSLRSNVDTKLIFSDETPRDGDLRGTQTADLYDPTFDDNRWGGFYRQKWRAKPGEFPLSVVVDGRYVSDDLFLREMEEPLIGLPQDRYLTSKARVRAPIGDYLNAEVSTEYSQSFVSNDDLVFQRLPQLTLDGYRSWRIFGINPYGLKLVTSGEITSTTFSRDTGYDGQRFDIHPKFKVPFYFMNYFTGDLNLGLRQTYYSLSESLDPDSGSDLDDSTDRGIYEFGANIGTVLERVYDVDSSGVLASMSNVGAKNQFDKLLRVKHTIEPFVGYDFTPEKDQSFLPLFDGDDRIRERSLVSYGFNSRLIGRFDDTAQKRGVIEELSPEENPFGFGPDTQDPAEMFGQTFFDENTTVRRIRGEKKQLASFGVRQSYDQKLENTEQRAFSDVGTDLSFYPNSYFGIGFGSNYDYEEGDFSSWGLGLKLEDDRGDHLRTRVSYIENSVSQVDGNVEIALTDRLKLGFYGRYDDLESEFVENRVALRIISSCDCWKLDIGYRDRVNPDDRDYTLLLTLRGLGDIGE